MHTILDQSQKTVAYLYSNTILDAATYAPIGIVLGNCLYTAQAQPCGRIFKNKIRYTDGTILGDIQSNTAIINIPENTIKECMQLAWHVIANLSGDPCLWVEENNKWNAKSLLSILHKQEHPHSPLVHPALNEKKEYA
ncbi:MAG: hypothetical protein J0I41_02115 [Filimonas sp.]|nr:hypothetical protein [Filimonas sp.]